MSWSTAANGSDVHWATGTWRASKSRYTPREPIRYQTNHPRRNSASESNRVKLCRAKRHRARIVSEFEDSEKMYVPPDTFGGISPERKLAQTMPKFFTWVAVHIVLAQLQNSAPKLNLPDRDSLKVVRLGQLQAKAA
eukprot:scaffold1564_cov389-Prasinococcus_capsulatus_cf.AAC.13